MERESARKQTSFKWRIFQLNAKEAETRPAIQFLSTRAKLFAEYFAQISNRLIWLQNFS